jgi:hypothetical protein
MIKASWSNKRSDCSEEQGFKTRIKRRKPRNKNHAGALHGVLIFSAGLAPLLCSLREQQKFVFPQRSIQTLWKDGSWHYANYRRIINFKRSLYRASFDAPLFLRQ